MNDPIITPAIARVANALAYVSMMLSPHELRVLLSMTAACLETKDGSLVASVEQLTLITGVSQVTLGKALKRLEEMGLVTITDRDGPFPRSYRIHFERMKAIGKAGPVEVPQTRKRTRKAA